MMWHVGIEEVKLGFYSTSLLNLISKQNNRERTWFIQQHKLSPTNFGSAMGHR